jgi:hypothetical protein
MWWTGWRVRGGRYFLTLYPRTLIWIEFRVTIGWFARKSPVAMPGFFQNEFVPHCTRNTGTHKGKAGVRKVGPYRLSELSPS